MTIAATSRVVLVMLLWAVCYPLIAVGIEFAPHLTFAAIRAIVAGLALTILAVALRQPLPKRISLWVTLAVVGFGATSLGFLGMFHAAEFVSPGVATVIANSQPLLAAVLGGMVLGERLSRRGKVGMLLGFIGIVVIAVPEVGIDARGSYLIGVAFIILAALGVTVGNVAIKRIVGQIDSLMAMGLQLLIGSVPLLLAASFMEDPTSVRWSSTFVSVLLALSLIGTSLAYWLWFLVLEQVPLNRANAFSFLTPIFGLTLGALFYGEALGWSQLAGVVLVITGVRLVMTQGAIPAAGVAR